MYDNGEKRTDIVVLLDEEGNEHDFALVDRFQVKMSEYAILVPVLYAEGEDDSDELELEDDAYIFRIDLEQGEETLVEVDDEHEWNEVAAVWEERVQEFDLEEDEGEIY